MNVGNQYIQRKPNMLLNRIRYKDNNKEIVEQSNVNNGEVYIDIQNTDYNVSTYGGEYYHHCEDCPEIDVAYYGIQMDDFSIEISPKTALSLFKELGIHLNNCGHDLKKLLPNTKNLS